MNKNTYTAHFKILLTISLFFIFIGQAKSATLTIPGEFTPPGIIGGYPTNAGFSWISHQFPDSEEYFSWKLGGGSDGGIIFDQSQAFTAMTDSTIMFNQPTGFFSVNNGISLDENMTIDMSNLRLFHGGSIFDIGADSGFDAFIPLINDINTLTANQNGWAIDKFGNYELFYNTRGICDGCTMQVYLTGTSVVPVPAAIWLFGSGLIGLLGFARRKKHKR